MKLTLLSIIFILSFQFATAQREASMFGSLPYGYGFVNQEFLVTNTADSGPGSLREAVNSARMAFSSKIGFRNSGAPMNIVLNSPLPTITGTCYIDGLTNVGQNGYSLAGQSNGKVYIQAGNPTVAKTPGIEITQDNSICFIAQDQFIGFSPTTYWVTTTSWSGPGSLMSAIRNANMISSFGTDSIKFNIPGGGVKEILLYAPMPNADIYASMYIDGTTQSGYAPGSPTIVMKNGNFYNSIKIRSKNVGIKGVKFSGASEGVSLGGKSFYQGGTSTNAENVEISECVFGECGSAGIKFNYASNETYSISYVNIHHNWIGCDVAGNAIPNPHGILIQQGSNITIKNNIISGNTNGGIYKDEYSGYINNIVIEGNKIGVNSNGNAVLPNKEGIYIVDGKEIVIKDNIISGNTESGITARSYWVSSNFQIKNNKIGTDITGALALPNKIGIYNVNAKVIIEHNIIAFNSSGISSTYNAVIRNNSTFNNANMFSGTAPVIVLKSASELNGTAKPNSKIQLFYDNGFNDKAQGKDFIAEVNSDAVGNWSYSGVIPNACMVTAIAYDSATYYSSGFSKIKYDFFPDSSVYCSGDTATLSVPVFSQTLWSTGETLSSVKLITQDKYWIRTSDGAGCDYSDTIDLKFISKPNVSLGADKDTCSGSSVSLDAGAFTNAKYYWNAESAASIATRLVTTSGYYRVRVEIGNCKNSDTVGVTFYTKPVLKLQNDTLICNSSSLNLDAKNPGATYLWSTGATTQTIQTASAGSYSLVCYYHPSCSRRDTVVVQTSDCNIVGGKVYQDVNSNCVKDGAESVLASRVVVVTRNSDQVSYYATTDVSGDYALNVPVGSYTIRTPDNNYPVFCPASGKYVVTVGNTVNSSRNFGTRFVANHDLAVGLVAPNPTVRLNSNFQYTISYSNKGNIVENGEVKLAVDPFIKFVSSDVSPQSTTDTIKWSFTNLNPGEVRVIQVTLNVPLNQSLAGTSSCQYATVRTSSVESVLSNNQISNCIRLVYPYDPNCKLVSPAGTGSQGYIASSDTSFVYTIHFQNTGSDVAHDVVIEDTISQLFDPTTIETISASASYSYSLTGNGLARWKFENIMLPDSNANETGSHGFVQFRIKNKSRLAQGTEITNKALIYFDLAAAVHTEYALNTVKDDLEPHRIFCVTPEQQIYPDLGIKLNAVSDAALPLHYIMDGPIAMVDDSVVFTGTGTARIRIMQEGDEYYLAADSKYLVFQIVKGTQALLFDTIVDHPITDNVIIVNAISNTSTPITYEVVSGPASLDGNALTFSGAGQITVKVYQAGNTFYEAAEVVRSFEVFIVNSLIKEEHIQAELYPNPAVHNCTLKLTGFVANEIIIRNSSGSEIHRTGFSGSSYSIPVGMLGAGIYYLEIRSEAGSVIRKLIVQ